jgi:hypothetical protein
LIIFPLPPEAMLVLILQNSSVFQKLKPHANCLVYVLHSCTKQAGDTLQIDIEKSCCKDI